MHKQARWSTVFTPFAVHNLRTAEVMICMISERLADRPRQLPLHSLTEKALCCSRTSAISSSPSQRTPHDVEEWPANHAHGSLPGCRGHLANYRGQAGREKEKLWCPEMGVSTWCVCK